MIIKTHFDVLVIGTPCVDLVFAGLPHWPVPGQELYVANFGISAGACFNTAATLSRLGLRVALLSELGNDFFSRFLLEEVEKAGISRDLLVIREWPLYSVSVCLAHDGERGFVSYIDRPGGIAPPGVNIADSPTPGTQRPALSPEELRDLLDTCDFDAAFLYAHPAAHPLLDSIARHGAKVFFDTGWNPRSLTDPRLPDVLRRGDFLMPNQAEATFMTHTETAAEAAFALAKLLPTAIVKLGAHGVIACQQEDLTRCPAFPIQEVIDTTGAGDAFNGGFIYGILKGYPLADALRCGTICGSLSTTAITGTAAVPTAQELERLRRE